MVFESYYDKENYFHLNSAGKADKFSKEPVKKSQELVPRTQGLIDSLKDLSLAGGKEWSGKSPQRRKKTRWSSPIRTSSKPQIECEQSNSLDSSIFEIFHSSDVSKSRRLYCEASPEKKKKTTHHHSSYYKSEDTKFKIHTQKKRREKQKDIRYYFKKNAKVKIIVYNDEDPLPMDVIKGSPKRSTHSENDRMEVEHLNAETKNEEEKEKEETAGVISDMEIENPIISKPETEKSKSKTISEITVKSSSSPTTKSSGSEEFISKNKLFPKSLSSNKPKIVEKDELCLNVKKTWKRERSPLVSPTKSQEKTGIDVNTKLVKFTRNLNNFNLRKILKPAVSSRFRRYNSMVEFSPSFSTPSSSHRYHTARTAATEPRNKRKINPKELFDELDKSEEREHKKARKSVLMNEITLTSSAQKKPLFTPTTELRCYGDIDLGVQPLPLTKECASCSTGETLLWRDTEDGIPLCNTCGIRWRKHRSRCTDCWYVPMQEEVVLPYCGSCGKYGTFKRFKTLRRHKTSVL